MKSTYHITVRGYELDSFGHLNNAVYLNYAEQAKWEFLNDNKLLEIVNQYGLFPVILENNIRYMHEFKLLDKVRIETEWICTHKILHFKHIFQTFESISNSLSPICNVSAMTIIFHF